MMLIFEQILDQETKKKKTEFAGQMSLFDFAAEEDKESFKVKVPNVAEYNKEDLLAFEKEVLGIYLSGHPLEKYSSIMDKMISAKSTDFQPDEETGMTKVYDGQKVIIGGMIADKKINIQKMIRLWLSLIWKIWLAI